MKVLQVNNVYGEKSTGKLTQILHWGLIKAGHESLVMYGRGGGAQEKNVYRLCPDWYGKLNSLLSRFTGLPYGGCHLATSKLIRFIRREKPDVVHLQCINGNFVNIYRLVSWLKKNEIKTVLTLHAEFMYTANCGHAFDCEKYRTGCGNCPRRKRATKSLLFDRTAASWRRMQEAFSGFGDKLTVVSVSPWLRQRVEAAPILREFRQEVVLNAVDTGVFHPYPREGEEKIVLHVTADFNDQSGHPKGGEYVLALAKRPEFAHVRFWVAAGRQSIAGEIPPNVQMLGNISDQEKLARLYSQADVTLLTSRRETFSMPCAESLCCGTPVVGFQAGAPEGISLKAYSQFVPFGDVPALAAALQRKLSETPCRDTVARDGARAYSTQVMIQNYQRIYRGIH